MKKKILILLVLLLLIFIIGYSNNQTFKDVTSLLNISHNNTNNDNDSPIFSFDENGYYTGFSNMPKNYSIQDAKDDGYFVTQDLEVAANENVWNNFIQSLYEKKIQVLE